MIALITLPLILIILLLPFFAGIITLFFKKELSWKRVFFLFLSTPAQIVFAFVFALAFASVTEIESVKVMYTAVVIIALFLSFIQTGLFNYLFKNKTNLIYYFIIPPASLITILFIVLVLSAFFPDLFSRTCTGLAGMEKHCSGFFSN